MALCCRSVQSKGLGVWGEELGFDFGVSAKGALEKPIGCDELVDQVLFGFVARLIGAEPGGFEGFQGIHAFGGQQYDGLGSAETVLGRIARGDIFTGRGAGRRAVICIHDTSLL